MSQWKQHLALAYNHRGVALSLAVVLWYGSGGRTRKHLIQSSGETTIP